MDKATSLATAFAAIAVAIVVVWALTRRRRLRLFKDLGIPGPEPDFIWGNVKQMNHRRIEAFMQWRKEFGKLFGIYIGSAPFVVIADAQMAHECLVKQAAIFQDRPAVFVDADPIKSSLLYLGGNTWKYVRARLNYGFSSGTIKELSEKADMCANKFVERISSISTRNGYVEVFDRGVDFAFDFIMSAVLAQEVRSQEGYNEPILDSLKKVIKDLEYSAIEVALMVPVIHTFLTLIYPLTRNAREFRSVSSHAQKKVELHRSGKLPKELSILQKLVDAQSENLNTVQDNRSRLDKHLDDHYLSSNVTIFLFAGIETTSSLLSFLMYILAKYPEEQQKLVEEIENVLVSEDGNEVCIDKLHLLKRVDMVIYEVLRLYPSVPLYVVRRCSMDTNVCGHFIPAGANVMVPPWLIHHDADYWSDPEEFLPDSFYMDKATSLGHSLRCHRRGHSRSLGAKASPKAQIVQGSRHPRARTGLHMGKYEADEPRAHRGNTWKYVRARLNYGFSSSTIKELSGKADVCANKFVERISSISSRNGYVEVFDRGVDFAFDFMMSVVLAQKVRSQEGYNEPILDSLKKVINDLEYTAIEVALMVPAIRTLITLIYPLTRNARELRRVSSHAQKKVELHRSGKLPKELSILQKLVDAQSENLNTVQDNRSRHDKHLDDHYLSSNLTMFLFAGIETTASLLSFLMYILARYPEEQQKLVEEIENVLAPEDGNEVCIDKLHLLKRVDMVIYEGLRLYPSIPLYVGKALFCGHECLRTLHSSRRQRDGPPMAHSS
ncbi:hypothetical protein MTO96_010502 [Rhipicephalus appendiculatus]